MPERSNTHLLCADIAEGGARPWRMVGHRRKPPIRSATVKKRDYGLLYRYRAKSSGSIFANRRMPRRVPIFNSL